MANSINEMTRARGVLLIAALVAVFWAGTAHAQPANSNSTGSQRDSADAPHLEFVFEEFVTLGAGIHPGETPFGERNMVPITGGTFSGPNIRGKVLSGGWDWQLATKTGRHSIQADYVSQTDDGAVINVVNKGTSCASPGATVRLITTPTFEAPLGPHAWLSNPWRKRLDQNGERAFPCRRLPNHHGPAIMLGRHNPNAQDEKRLSTGRCLCRTGETSQRFCEGSSARTAICEQVGGA